MISRNHWTVLVVLLLFSGQSVFANGDPVTSYSSVHRVANPEPLPIPEIYIVDEQVNIKHVEGYNCYDITYRFKNDSDNDFSEIDYGFPIDYLVANEQETFMIVNNGWTESIDEVGWSDKLIKDVSFRLDNRYLAYHSAKESISMAGYEKLVMSDSLGYDTVDVSWDEISEATDAELEDLFFVRGVHRLWLYTTISIAPHAEAVLNVSYKVYAPSIQHHSNWDTMYASYDRKEASHDYFIFTEPMLLRYFTTRFIILYDFAPAKYFGDSKPYHLNVKVDLSNLDNPSVWSDGPALTPTTLIVKDYEAANPAELEPINLYVNYSPSMDLERIENLISALAISPDEYDIAITDNVVELKFYKPTFVSEIACYIGTENIDSVIATISYVNEPICQYIYTKHQPSKYDGDAKLRIKSPAILVITDWFHNGAVWESAKYANGIHSENPQKFKPEIDYIRLEFNSDTPLNDIIKNCNIRPLDSRFERL